MADDRLKDAEPEVRSKPGWNPVTAIDGGYANSKKMYDNVSLRKGFKDRGLQVYVEILTINVGSKDQ